MVLTCSELEERYIDYCKRRMILPNQDILAAFAKAEARKSCHELCCLNVPLNHLKDVDVLPLLDLLKDIDASEIDAVDISSGSSCTLSGHYALSLIHATNQKLRVVDVQDWPFGKDFLRDLSHRGLTCQILSLRCSHFRKLNLTGDFLQLHTLNLDFSASLSSFLEDCFTCMPNLMHLSMCETRVANLWTTIAALSKLPSLVELRFQKCLYCNDTGACPSSSVREDNSKMDSTQPDTYSYVGAPSEFPHQDLHPEEALRNLFSVTSGSMNHEVQSASDDSSDDSEVDFSSHQHAFGLEGLLYSEIPCWNEPTAPLYEGNFNTLGSQNEEETLAHSFNSRHIHAFSATTIKYMSVHPSPICSEKHYREFLIASLPCLRVLDNLLVSKIEKKKAKVVFSQSFEYLPYKRQHKESVVSILHKREMKASHTVFRSLRDPKLKRSCSSGKSRHCYSRSLCAAKMGSSAWPFLHPLSISDNSGDDRTFRPRQFEYHPSNSSLMVFGTLDGEVVVVNHENGKIVSYIPSQRAMNNSVLGLCWLKKYPSKLIAGSDNGSLNLYDIERTPSTLTGVPSSGVSVTFDEFNQLTSVHVNSTDELFIASGYSRNVALYDINTRRCLQVFNDMHREHINVVKFANHSPSIFATSSFDQDVKLWDLRQNPVRPCYTTSSSRGNVMVCFSPDDYYLLVSAVDNEVKQLLTADGRLHLNFEIASTGSSQNYTRSYYMSGRDYIISGSCDEHVVRICCSQTGRRLRDISLEGRGSRTSMFVQSLRGDPFRDFNMSILAAYTRPSSKSEIVKVNLLASSDSAKDYSCSQHSCPANSMGG